MVMCVCAGVGVCEQIRIDGVDNVKSMLRKGFDGTIVPIKMIEVRCKQE